MQNDKIFIYWKENNLNKLLISLYSWTWEKNIRANDVITEIASQDDKILDYLFNKYWYELVYYIKKEANVN